MEKDKVKEAKEEFIMNVNALKYATTLMDADFLEFSHSSLTSALKNVVQSYEKFINSKIEFTNEHFKNQSYENT